MSDESDAEFERRYPQKRSGMPVWAILLIVFGATGFVGVFGLFALGMVFGAVAAVAPPGPPPVMMTVENEPRRLPDVIPRGVFDHLVIGRTPAEVKAAVGEPPMSVGMDGEETWMYRERTTNPATGRPDEVAAVVFRGGKVVRVDYRDADPAPGGPGPAPDRR